MVLAEKNLLQGETQYWGLQYEKEFKGWFLKLAEGKIVKAEKSEKNV